MRPADLATIRMEAIRTLAAVDPRRLALIIADNRNGYPSGGYDAVSGSGCGSSSTEAAALTPDHAAHALDDLGRVMATLRRAVDELGHLHAMWTAQPRRAVCQNCLDPTGSFQKTHCRFCVEFQARNDRFPNPQEVARKQMGGRNRNPAAA